MYVCIMRQCFGVGTSYGSWLGLTIPAQGWDVTVELAVEPLGELKVIRSISDEIILIQR
jgi:hypothetical protein